MDDDISTSPPSVAGVAGCTPVRTKASSAVPSTAAVTVATTVSASSSLAHAFRYKCVSLGRDDCSPDPIDGVAQSALHLPTDIGLTLPDVISLSAILRHYAHLSLRCLLRKPQLMSMGVNGRPVDRITRAVLATYMPRNIDNDGVDDDHDYDDGRYDHNGPDYDRDDDKGNRGSANDTEEDGNMIDDDDDHTSTVTFELYMQRLFSRPFAQLSIFEQFLRTWFKIFYPHRRAINWSNFYETGELKLTSSAASSLATKSTSTISSDPTGSSPSKLPSSKSSNLPSSSNSSNIATNQTQQTVPTASFAADGGDNVGNNSGGGTGSSSGGGSSNSNPKNRNTSAAGSTTLTNDQLFNMYETFVTEVHHLVRRFAAQLLRPSTSVRRRHEPLSSLTVRNLLNTQRRSVDDVRLYCVILHDLFDLLDLYYTNTRVEFVVESPSLRESFELARRDVILHRLDFTRRLVTVHARFSRVRDWLYLRDLFLTPLVQRYDTLAAMIAPVVMSPIVLKQQMSEFTLATVLDVQQTGLTLVLHDLVVRYMLRRYFSKGAKFIESIDPYSRDSLTLDLDLVNFFVFLVRRCFGGEDFHERFVRPLGLDNRYNDEHFGENLITSFVFWRNVLAHVAVVAPQSFVAQLLSFVVPLCTVREIHVHDIIDYAVWLSAGEPFYTLCTCATLERLRTVGERKLHELFAFLYEQECLLFYVLLEHRLPAMPDRISHASRLHEMLATGGNNKMSTSATSVGRSGTTDGSSNYGRNSDRGRDTDSRNNSGRQNSNLNRRDQCNDVRMDSAVEFAYNWKTAFESMYRTDVFIGTPNHMCRLVREFFRFIIHREPRDCANDCVPYEILQTVEVLMSRRNARSTGGGKKKGNAGGGGGGVSGNDVTMDDSSSSGGLPLDYHPSAAAEQQQHPQRGQQQQQQSASSSSSSGRQSSSPSTTFSSVQPQVTQAVLWDETDAATSSVYFDVLQRVYNFLNAVLFMYNGVLGNSHGSDFMRLFASKNLQALLKKEQGVWQKDKLLRVFGLIFKDFDLDAFQVSSRRASMTSVPNLVIGNCLSNVQSVNTSFVRVATNQQSQQVIWNLIVRRYEMAAPSLLYLLTLDTVNWAVSEADSFPISPDLTVNQYVSQSLRSLDDFLTEFQRVDALSMLLYTRLITKKRIGDNDSGGAGGGVAGGALGGGGSDSAGVFAKRIASRLMENATASSRAKRRDVDRDLPDGAEDYGGNDDDNNVTDNAATRATAVNDQLCDDGGGISSYVDFIIDRDEFFSLAESLETTYVTRYCQRIILDQRDRLDDQQSQEQQTTQQTTQQQQQTTQQQQQTTQEQRTTQQQQSFSRSPLPPPLLQLIMLMIQLQREPRFAEYLARENLSTILVDVLILSTMSNDWLQKRKLSTVPRVSKRLRLDEGVAADRSGSEGGGGWSGNGGGMDIDGVTQGSYSSADGSNSFAAFVDRSLAKIDVSLFANDSLSEASESGATNLTNPINVTNPIDATKTNTTGGETNFSSTGNRRDNRRAGGSGGAGKVSYDWSLDCSGLSDTDISSSSASGGKFASNRMLNSIILEREFYERIRFLFTDEAFYLWTHTSLADFSLDHVNQLDDRTLLAVFSAYLYVIRVFADLPKPTQPTVVSTGTTNDAASAAVNVHTLSAAFRHDAVEHLSHLHAFFPRRFVVNRRTLDLATSMTHWMENRMRAAVAAESVALAAVAQRRQRLCRRGSRRSHGRRQRTNNDQQSAASANRRRCSDIDDEEDEDDHDDDLLPMLPIEAEVLAEQQRNATAFDFDDLLNRMVDQTNLVVSSVANDVPSGGDQQHDSLNRGATATTLSPTSTTLTTQANHEMVHRPFDTLPYTYACSRLPFSSRLAINYFCMVVFLFCDMDLAVTVYLLRLIVSFLYPGVESRECVIVRGSSGSGKSQFFDLLREFLNSQNGILTTQAICNGGNLINTQFLPLGKNFLCQCDEPKRVDNETFKLLISVVPIAARAFQNQMAQSIPILAKLVLTVNNMFQIESDDGILERLHTVFRLSHKHYNLINDQTDMTRYNCGTAYNLSHQLCARIYPRDIDKSLFQRGLFYMIHHWSLDQTTRTNASFSLADQYANLIQRPLCDQRATLYDTESVDFRAVQTHSDKLENGWQANCQTVALMSVVRENLSRLIFRPSTVAAKIVRVVPHAHTRDLADSCVTRCTSLEQYLYGKNATRSVFNFFANKTRTNILGVVRLASGAEVLKRQLRTLNSVENLLLSFLHDSLLPAVEMLRSSEAHMLVDVVTRYRASGGGDCGGAPVSLSYHGTSDHDRRMDLSSLPCTLDLNLVDLQASLDSFVRFKRAFLVEHSTRPMTRDTLRKYLHSYVDEINRSIEDVRYRVKYQEFVDRFETEYAKWRYRRADNNQFISSLWSIKLTRVN